VLRIEHIPTYFHFCRGTSEAAQVYRPLNTTDSSKLPVPPLPTSIYPGHHAVATSNAGASRAWAARLFGVLNVSLDYSATGLYSGADGTCAEVRWASLNDNDFKLHFVTQTVKRQGPLRVADYEARVRAMRPYGGALTPDALSLSRVGFSTADPRPIVDAVVSANESYSLVDGGGLLVHAPWGFLVELLPADAADVAFDARAYGPLELCFLTGCTYTTGDLRQQPPPLAAAPPAFVLMVAVGALVLPALARRSIRAPQPILI